MTSLRRFVRQIRGRDKPPFANEKAILSGKKIRTCCKSPSVLFFTIHKAASTYVNQVLCDVLQAANFKHADLAGYRFQSTEKLSEIRPEHIQPNGMYYGALRGPIELPLQNEFKIILQVRDPRDVITSFYYSILYSHRFPGNEQRRIQFERTRLNLEQRGIDKYAKAMNVPTLRTLNAYAEEFFNRKDVLVVHYEDMVNNFPGWLDRITEFLDLKNTRRYRDALERVKQEADFEVQQEDVFSHKRQVTPGDHLRKLQPETVHVINQAFQRYFDLMASTENLPKTYRLPDTKSMPLATPAHKARKESA